jgi:hypothetical protein
MLQGRFRRDGMMNHHPRIEPNSYVPILIPRGVDWFCLAGVGRFWKAPKERYARAAQHYAIEVKLDEVGKAATAITWIKTPKPGTALTDPGVYCLRTTLTAPSDAELWKTYSMLTNLEAVFRSLKTDLGLRPVFHQTESRVDAHLFISLLAYVLVHTLRTQLKASGINDSWDKLRSILSGQVRITATVQRKDGRTVHVRKATRPEVALQRIYTQLKISANPGGVQQTIA